MPRNGSGTYTLPVPPFTPGTVISSSDVNSDFSDIATALTGSLAADGQTPITGQLRGTVGTTAPPYSIGGDLNTGFGAAGADQPAIVAGGVAVLVGSTTSISVTGTFTSSGALTVTSGGITISAGNLAVSSGGATFATAVTVSSGGIAVTGNSTITGTLIVTSNLTVNSGTVTLPAGSLNGSALVDSSVLLAKLEAIARPMNGAYSQVREQFTSGTSGGSLSSGTWNTRALNTLGANDLGLSLGSNQFSLVAGTYYIEAFATSHFNGTMDRSTTEFGGQKLRLRNITDSTTADLAGVSQRFNLVDDAGGNNQLADFESFCGLTGRFTIGGTKTFELQCWITNSLSGGTTISGKPLSSGEPEVYTMLNIFRVG